MHFYKSIQKKKAVTFLFSLFLFDLSKLWVTTLTQISYLEDRKKDSLGSISPTSIDATCKGTSHPVLHYTYALKCCSARRLIESTVYCNQKLLLPLYPNITQKCQLIESVVIVITFCWPLLSGGPPILDISFSAGYQILV